MVDVTADAPLGDEAGFAVGTILGRSLAVFRRDLGKFVLLAGIFLLPDLTASLIFPDVGVGSKAPAASGWKFVVAMLQVFAEVAVISAAFAQMNGHAVGIWDALQESGRRFRPAMLATVFQSLSVVLGLVLLIAPGLILFTMMYVILPVCVAEQTGATASINRSAALTRGSRWKVFGIALVANIGGAFVLVVVGALAAAFVSPAVLAFVTYLMQLVYLSFTAVVTVVVYEALRAAKEGPRTEVLAEVFA